MNIKFNIRIFILVIMIFIGLCCQGWNRGMSSCCASSFGSDWLVIQYNYNGELIQCWKLTNTSVDNEPHSDGIYWLDNKTNHLVHISGWYNRIQVVNGNFESASKLLRIDLSKCNE